MGIKTVLHPPYSPDVSPSDFWLFPKLRSCRYETIEEMKEAVTKVIDTLTQEDFHGGFRKLLERYKCIAAGGDNFEGRQEFHEGIINMCPYELFNDPRKWFRYAVKPNKTKLTLIFNYLQNDAKVWHFLFLEIIKHNIIYKGAVEETRESSFSFFLFNRISTLVVYLLSKKSF